MPTQDPPTSPADADSSPTARRFAVPADLSAWADRPLLLQWVVEELDSLDWAHPQLTKHLREHPGFQPRFLLALLIFAYATGRYESEEIVDCYFAEPTLKRLFPGQNPTTAVLRRFRRDHRGLLKWGLSQLMKRAVRHHYQLGDVAVPAGLRRLLEQAAAVRLDAARHFDRSVEGE